MGTPGQAKNAQRKQEGAARRAQVMELRASGMQPTAIAERLHLTPRSVFRHISRALAEVVASATNEYRALEAARLDALIHAYWEKALNGNLPAAHLVSKIIGQRMALFGLVQPPSKEDDLSDALLATLQRVQAHCQTMQAAAEPPAVPADALAAPGSDAPAAPRSESPPRSPAWERALAAGMPLHE